MKKIFILILIILGAWQAYSAQSVEVQAEIKTKTDYLTKQFFNSDIAHSFVKAKAIVQSESYFVCDKRQFCSQMDNVQEAQFFLDNCPSVQMDVDYDGIACEKEFPEI